MIRIKYFCGIFLVFLICFVCSSYENTALGRGCIIPQIRHGRVQSMQRGHLVKFICNLGFKLLGNRYAVCSMPQNRKWDISIPVCIKTGCDRLDRLENGIAYYTHRGAAVLFVCNPEHQLVGSKTAYCDGAKWNATLPSCISTNVATPLSCDFENPDMCGWRQDELHDFDWLRMNHATPSNSLETGPKYDHTLGAGKDGYYMYIESSSKLQNDKARLLSPLYKGDLTKDGCFSFYYHMYGKTTGTLKVYVKPEALDLQEMLNYDPEKLQRYTFFTKSGNQGDFWHRALFNFNQLEDNFEIILEGIRGPGYTSDIAIDDVAILQDAECSENSDMETSTELLPTFTDSCQNRCGIGAKLTAAGEEVKCQCTEGCWENSNCCVDYLDLCPFSSTENSETSVVVTEKSSLPPFLPQGMKRVASNVTDHSEDIMPISIPQFPRPVPNKIPNEVPKAITAILKNTTSTPKTTTTTFKRIPMTIPTTIKRIPTTTSASTTNPTTITVIITTPTTPTTSTTVKTTKQTVEKKNTPKPTFTPKPRTKNISSETESVKNSTTQRQPIKTMTTTTKLPKYSRTINNHNDDIWNKIVRHEERKEYLKHDIARQTNLALDISLIIVFIIIIVVGITVMVRHRNLRNYITRRHNYMTSRGTSEVRFITNEEEVDFE